MPAPQIDFSRFTPDMLPQLSAREFADIVEGDLRNPRYHELSEPLAAALRRPENVERWFANLTKTARAVDGQLATNADEFQGKLADLRRDQILLRQRLRDDSILSQPQLQRDLTASEAEMEQLRSAYFKGRMRRLRFKTAVDETLLEAKALRDGLRANLWESALAEERNWHAQRSQTLAAAIRDHRRACTDQDIQPEPHDESLWAAIKDPT